MPRTGKTRLSKSLPPPKPYVGARASGVRLDGERLVVDLVDGRTLITPLSLIPGFNLLPRGALEDHEIVGGGIGIHFPRIDEDVSVDNLLRPELVVRPTALPRVQSEEHSARRRRGAQ